jgi:hypothetical protein
MMMGMFFARRGDHADLKTSLMDFRRIVWRTADCIHWSAKCRASSSYVPVTGPGHIRAHPEGIELPAGEVKPELHRFADEGREVLPILPGDHLHCLIGTNGMTVLPGKGGNDLIGRRPPH